MLMSRFGMGFKALREEVTNQGPQQVAASSFQAQN